MDDAISKAAEATYLTNPLRNKGKVIPWDDLTPHAQNLYARAAITAYLRSWRPGDTWPRIGKVGPATIAIAKVAARAEADRLAGEGRGE